MPAGKMIAFAVGLAVGALAARRRAAPPPPVWVLSAGDLWPGNGWAPSCWHQHVYGTGTYVGVVRIARGDAAEDEHALTISMGRRRHTRDAATGDAQRFAARMRRRDWPPGGA